MIIAGLPKKFAKMGFKNGWREYRKSKASSKKMSVRNVAKKKVSSGSAKKRPGMMNKLTQMNVKDKIVSGVYGAVRGKISEVNPLKQMFNGWGDYADEGAMFVGAQAVKAFLPGSRAYMEKIQDIESFLIGFQVAQGTTTGTTSGSSYPV
jgi:hypothetical protein